MDSLSIFGFSIMLLGCLYCFRTLPKKRDGSDRVSELTSLVLEPSILSELTELPAGRYQLPNITKEVALFKGAQFNENELAEQLSRSKSFSRLFQRSGLDNVTKRPLLPLSIGQIGLVGGSGLINGLVDCDTPHIIKGRIVKEKRIRTEEIENAQGDLVVTTLIETTSNKLIFNLLTANGFVPLTDYDGGGTVVVSDDEPSEDSNSRLVHSSSCGSDGIASTDKAFNSGNGSSTYLTLGTTVITRIAREVLTDEDIHGALRRHQVGDWGTVSKGDRGANDKAVKNGERILSSYLSTNGEQFWIITEWDRSATTVLMPDEY